MGRRIANAHAHTDAGAYPNTHTIAYSKTHPNPHANTYPDTDAYAYSNTYKHSQNCNNQSRKSYGSGGNSLFGNSSSGRDRSEFR